VVAVHATVVVHGRRRPQGRLDVADLEGNAKRRSEGDCPGLPATARRRTRDFHVGMQGSAHSAERGTLPVDEVAAAQAAASRAGKMNPMP